MGFWKIKRTKKILSNKFLKVLREHVVLPNGTEIKDYFITQGPDIVLIIPILRNKKIALIQEYKHGVKGRLTSFPAGMHFSGSLLSTAKRELREETGLSSREWEKLGSLSGMPHRERSKTEVFVAMNCVRMDKPKLEDTEQINIVEVSKNEVGKILTKERPINGIALAAWGLFEKS